MANRFPLVIDTDDGNRIKELPLGDNLNLEGSSIVNATNLNVQTITLNGSSLNNFSGSFADITGKPTTLSGYGIVDAFDGTWASLSGKPTVPSNIQDLANVESGTPADNQVLKYNATSGIFEFADTNVTLSLGQLTDTVVVNEQTGQVIKYNGATFVNDTVDWEEITNKPNFVTQGDTLDGDLVGSVFADNSTKVIDGITGHILTDTFGVHRGTNIDAGGDLLIKTDGSVNPSTITIRHHLSGETILNANVITLDAPEINATGTITAASFNGSLTTDDSLTIVDAITNSVTAINGTFTNLKGNLLTSDGAVVINTAGAGSIPETVTVQKLDDFITDFKAAVAASTDLADLQSRIAALTYP